MAKTFQGFNIRQVRLVVFGEVGPPAGKYVGGTWLLISN